MKIDWQHVLAFFAPILIAIGNGIQDHWSPVSIGMLVASVGGGATLASKASVLPSVTQAAAVKNVAEEILK